MAILICLLMNSLVVISSFIITYRLFKLINFFDSLICWFILYFAQIIFTELFLGILGHLYLKEIVLFSFSVLIIIWLIAKNSRTSFSLSEAREAVSRLLRNKINLLMISFILGFVLVKVSINLINPPFGWDSLNYHFSFPVEWLKSGRLDNPIVVSDDPFPTYYPINGSLLFFWLILPFKNAFLADLSQLPFFVLSFISIFSICRKLSLGKEYSFLAAGLFLFIPNFFKQLQIGYVDIMLAGIFLTVINFILLLKENFNLKNIIILGISFGIFIGIKTTALSYSIFLLIPFLYLNFWQVRLTFNQKIRNIILLFLVVFIFGGFSYIRNIILTGNPFYPLEIAISSSTILKGVIDRPSFTFRNVKEGYSLNKLLFHEGLGIQTLLIVIPGIFLAIPFNILKKRNRDLFLNYILLLPILLYLVYRFILPIPNSRYLYPVLGIGMAVGFYFLYSVGISSKISRMMAMIFIIISSFECSRRTELGISLGLSFLLFAIFIIFLKYRKLRAILSSKGFRVVGIFISLVILQRLLFDYEKNEFQRYVRNSRYWPDATLAWFWLNNNTIANNIAYVGRPVPYPLYGRNLKNNVYYVSINSLDPIHLHDLKNSRYRFQDKAENMHKSFCEPNNYRGNADYSIWLDNLNRRKIDFLFIYSLHHTENIEFPIEELWARSHCDKFDLVFSNETIRIYKLKR